MGYLRNLACVTGCLFSLVLLAAMGAQAASKKPAPVMLKAHIVLNQGGEATLSDIRGDTFKTEFKWQSFRIFIRLSAIRGLEFTGEANKQKQGGKLSRPVVLTLVDGGRFTCEMKYFPNLGLNGKWDFGKKTIPFAEIKSIQFECDAPPSPPPLELIGEIIDIKGNKLNVGPGIEFKLSGASFVKRALFGSADAAYFPVPQGDGFFLAPSNDIKELSGDGSIWTVSLTDGKSLKVPLTKVTKNNRVTGTCQYGKFELMFAELGHWQWTTPPSAVKIGGKGHAGQKPNKIDAQVTDSQGMSFNLENIAFFYAVTHYGMWIPRMPENHPVWGDRFTVFMSGQQTADIELNSLKSLVVAKYPEFALTAKSGSSIQAKLKKDSRQKGVNMGNLGFIGRFETEYGNYWGFYPFRSIKEMKFK